MSAYKILNHLDKQEEKLLRRQRLIHNTIVIAKRVIIFSCLLVCAFCFGAAFNWLPYYIPPSLKGDIVTLWRTWWNRRHAIEPVEASAHVCRQFSFCHSGSEVLT